MEKHGQEQYTMEERMDYENTDPKALKGMLEIGKYSHRWMDDGHVFR